MASCARILLGCVNVLMLLYSIVYIFIVVAFRHISPSRCFNNTYNMHLWLSIFMLVISVIGIIGSCCKSKSMQCLYSWVAVIATIVSATFITFLFTTFPKESPYSLYDKIDKSPNGNWLYGYSPYLRKALVDDKSWFSIKSCLVEMDFCKLYRKKAAKESKSQFALKFRFPELGCCHPPSRCGMTLKNETQYELSKEASKDNECQTWWTKFKDGCFDCDSCKAGFIAKDQDQWQSRKGFYFGFIVFLLIATFMSCYAAREKDRY